MVDGRTGEVCTLLVNVHRSLPQHRYSRRRSPVVAGRAVAGGWRLVGRSVARDVSEVDDSVHSALKGHNAASWSEESSPDSYKILSMVMD